MSKVGSLLGFNFIEIPYIWGLGWDLTVPFVSTSLTLQYCWKKEHSTCTHMCFDIAFSVKKLMCLLLLLLYLSRLQLCSAMS